MKNGIFCLQLQYSLLFTLKNKGFVVQMSHQLTKRHRMSKVTPGAHPQFVLQEVHLMGEYLVSVDEQGHGWGPLV